MNSITRRYHAIIVDIKDSIISVIKKMDVSQHKLLMVFKDEKFYRLISIGDIQRAIIANIDVNQSIDKILRNETTVAHIDDDLNSIKNSMKKKRTEFMPILDLNQNVHTVIFWNDLFKENRNEILEQDKINLPVVIMAGGKGTRLQPLTNILPKPLIPISDKTIIEEIMDRFTDIGCHNFLLSVNYKAELIKYYFDNLNNKQYKLTYFKENRPLGTAGSLSLMKNEINSTFFVSNCDIIIDQDYSEIYKYHKQNHNEITIVSALKTLSIPYGTLQTNENGQLKQLIEKPTQLYKINAGLYILEPELIKEIPSNTFYHITYLIEKLLKENRKVGVFPISEGSWTDIGNWNEYKKILDI